MNLLTSYAWLREYLPCDLSPEAFAARISLSGPAVEKIIPRDANWDKILVGKITKVSPHPEADRLKVLSVDVGQSSPLAIVCGGMNVAEGLFVPVALLGAKVRWHGEGELVTMELTKIRGVESQGMVCASDEIGLLEAFPKKEDREILDLGLAGLDEKELVPGRPLGEALGVSGDVVMDIEVTTNRPDAMCIAGLAREAGAILDLPYKELRPADIEPQAGAKALDVTVEDTTRCPRYTAVRIDGVTNGPSPWWMKQRLLSAGVRPISLLVDITNYVMLEMARPLHVFDADKVQGPQIRIRSAKTGESIQALDGKTYQLEPGMLVIADGSAPVAVAGVMGGEASGVTSETTSIIFECAAFDPVVIRRTARALNLYSDSQSLFEKGLSTESPLIGLKRAVELCLQLAGGGVTSQVYDSQTSAYKSKEYSISLQQARSLIGVDLPTDEMVGTLERLGFQVRVEKGALQAVVPWWRDHDIEDGRDLVEEIARVHGYANLPSVFPAGISGRPSDAILDLEDSCRTILQGAGATEVYSYAFVSADQLEKTGYVASEAFHLQNPLASEQEYMRVSLLPGMLQAVVENQERVSDQVYFEIANVFVSQGKATLPDERPMCLTILCGNDDVWKRAKGMAELMLERFGVRHVEWKPVVNDVRQQWHPGRSACVMVDGREIGRVGELHPEMAAAWKLNQRLGVCELDLALLQNFAHATLAYAPIPEFPASKRDLSIVVSKEVTVEQVTHVIKDVATLPAQVEWFDTYIGRGVETGQKSLAFHLTFQESTRTLSSEEVEKEMEKIMQGLQAGVAAEVRR